MQKTWLQAAALTLFMSLSLQATAAPDEQEFLKPFKGQPGQVVRYLDEGGKPLSYAQFQMQRVADSKFVVRSTEEGVRIQLMSAEMMAEFNKPAAYKVNPGQAFPAFKFKDLSGKVHDQSVLTGRYTVMSLYFAECKPCIAEVPALNVFQQKNANLQLLALTFDDTAKSKEFVKAHGLKWPVLPDAKPLLADLGVRSYPSFVVINPEGKLLGIKNLGQELDAADTAAGHPHLSEWVQALIAKDKAG